MNVERWGRSDFPPPAQLHGAALKRQYAYGFLWVILATLGNAPVDGEYDQCVFAIVCTIIGVLVYAFIVGTAAGLLSEMNALAVEKKEKMDFINKYMMVKKLPRKLQDKVRAYYDYVFASTGRVTLSQEHDAFEDLPEPLALRLRLLENAPSLRRTQIFNGEGIEPGALELFALHLRPLIAFKGMVIVRERAPMDRVHFVTRGCVCAVALGSERDGFDDARDALVALADRRAGGGLDDSADSAGGGAPSPSLVARLASGVVRADAGSAAHHLHHSKLEQRYEQRVAESFIVASYHSGENFGHEPLCDWAEERQSAEERGGGGPASHENLVEPARATYAAAQFSDMFVLEYGTIMPALRRYAGLRRSLAFVGARAKQARRTISRMAHARGLGRAFRTWKATNGAGARPPQSHADIELVPRG